MFKRYRLAAAVAAAAALAVATGAPPPMDEDMAELAHMVRESCLAESGVALALLEQVNSGAALPDDAELKCYIKCVMETAGMLADGVVDVEVVLALLPDAVRQRNEAALRACGTRAGADHCDTAWRTQRCWQDADPENYFLI